jgi:manganese transport protein
MPRPSENVSREGPNRSLPEVHGSVAVPSRGPAWRQWLAVSGPALMVSVGYMDPGNWATDIAAGSRYEYRLLWVLVMSNFMAIVLQTLAARLGIVRRLDLAQASRETFPRAVVLPLYVLAEIAIAACDLAGVLGTAIAFNLLFHIPLLAGVMLTVLDVLILLVLLRFGIRKLEAVVLALVGTIGAALLIEILVARPDWGGMAAGLIPALPDSGALYLAIGILGATIMPHNLYLHSALVQTRRFSGGPEEMSQATRLNLFDTTIALNFALLINAALLVTAAAVFFRSGHQEITGLSEAHRLLEPLLGVAIAPIAFGVALLASGQSSTVTGTLAGQIVMEGYLDLRIPAWLRRLLTRLLAVVPAVLTIVYVGEQGVGRLLVLSQVILSLQLPFAVVPLIHLVSDRGTMGEHAVTGLLRSSAWLIAIILVGLNAALVGQVARSWVAGAGDAAWLAQIGVVTVGAGLLGLLAWVSLHPWLSRWFGLPRRAEVSIHPASERPTLTLSAPETVRRVAIALDFSGREELLLNEALRFLAPGRPVIGLFHVVESPSARAHGPEVMDAETRADAARLESCAAALRSLGYEAHTRLGAGSPAKELARMVEEFAAELVILGGHGHRGLSDMIHGTTADALRHRVKASVLVIPLGR